MNAITITAVAVVVIIGILLLLRRDRPRRIGRGPDDPPAPQPPRDPEPGISQDPASPHLSEADRTEVLREIASGRKISAIKLVREKTGMGLKEAKEFVDDFISWGGH
jgi:hypothetical protein